MLLGVGGLRQDSRQFPPLPRDDVRTVTNLLYPPPQLTAYSLTRFSLGLTFSRFVCNVMRHLENPGRHHDVERLIASLCNSTIDG